MSTLLHRGTWVEVTRELYGEPGRYVPVIVVRRKEGGRVLGEIVCHTDNLTRWLRRGVDAATRRRVVKMLDGLTPEA